jgi:hypothetical protein
LAHGGAFLAAAGEGDFDALVAVLNPTRLLYRPCRGLAVLGFTVAEGRILEIDLIADPEKLRTLAEPG